DVGSFTGSTGTYALSGGTLTAKSEAIGVLGTGAFVQTGGANACQSLRVNRGTYTLSGTGRLDVVQSNASNVTIGGTDPGDTGTNIQLDGLKLEPGGNFVATAAGTFDGKFTHDGGVVSGTLNNNGTFVYQSGTFNGQLVNRGTIILNGQTFAPTMTVINEDTGVFNGAGTLVAGLINRGTVN